MLYRNADLHNVVELEPSDKGEGQHLLRVPSSLRATLNDAAKGCAAYPSGCEIRFNLKPGGTAKVVLAVEAGDVTPTTAEIYQGCFRILAPVIGASPTELLIKPSVNQARLDRIGDERKLPFDSRLTRIILPPTVPVRLVSIEGDIEPPRPGQTPKRRYLAYGSSITHGANACRPSGTYTMLTARHLQADLISHGYGGGAHMEQTMAQYLAGRDDWDFATLEMGINVGGWKSDLFHKTTEQFVRTIASAHPDKWIFCIDIFPFAADVGAGMNEHCQGFRDIVRQVVADLKMPKVVHVSGPAMLTDPSGLSHDLVHPTDDGFAQMAWNLAGVMKGRLGI